MRKTIYHKYFRSQIPFLLWAACIIAFATVSCDSGNDDDDDNGGYEEVTYDGLGYKAPEADYEPFVFTGTNDKSIMAFYLNQETSKIKSGYYICNDQEYLVRFNTDGLPVGAYSKGYYFAFSEYTDKSVKVTAFDNLQQQLKEVTYSDNTIGSIKAAADIPPVLRSTALVTNAMLKSLSAFMELVSKAGNQAISGSFLSPSLTATVSKHWGDSMDKGLLTLNLFDAMDKFNSDLTNYGTLAYELDNACTRLDDANRALMSKMRELNFFNNLNSEASDRIKVDTKAIVSLIHNKVTFQGNIIVPSGEIPENTPIKAEIYIGRTPPPSTKNAEKTHTYTSTNNLFSFVFNTGNLTPNTKYFAQHVIYYNGKPIRGNIDSFIIGTAVAGQGWSCTQKMTIKVKVSTSVPGGTPIVIEQTETSTDSFDFEIVDGAISIPHPDYVVINSSVKDDQVNLECVITYEGVKMTCTLKGKMDSSKKKMSGTTECYGTYSSSEGGVTVSMEMSGTGTWEAVYTE